MAARGARAAARTPRLQRWKPARPLSRLGRQPSCRRCARAGVAMWSRPLALALLLLPAPALAGVKERVATLAPTALVLVMDAKGNELVAQNTDEPFVPASVTKIVTAWLAMGVLGGGYRFETRFYLDD